MTVDSCDLLKCRICIFALQPTAVIELRRVFHLIFPEIAKEKQFIHFSNENIHH